LLVREELSEIVPTFPTYQRTLQTSPLSSAFTSLLGKRSF